MTLAILIQILIYIHAAVSAFFVVNNILSGILNWFVPTIICSVYVAYSIIQLNKGRKL